MGIVPDDLIECDWVKGQGEKLGCYNVDMSWYGHTISIELTTGYEGVGEDTTEQIKVYREGLDVTENYILGADKTPVLALARNLFAIMQLIKHAEEGPFK